MFLNNKKVCGEPRWSATKQASQKVKISNFMGLFCLKGTLIQPKTVAGVSSCDTKGPWKVWGKTDTWFPIQPKKNSANFVEAGKKGRKFKFYGFFLSKRYIGSTKNCGRTWNLWHWRAKVWGKTNSWFPIQPKKNWVKFRRAGEKVKFSNFIGWLCLKDKLLVQQIDTAVSCPDTEGPCAFKLFFWMEMKSNEIKHFHTFSNYRTTYYLHFVS